MTRISLPGWHHQVTESADLIVCDSLVQCREFGELSFALANGKLHADNHKIRELGTAVGDAQLHRSGPADTRLIICDLTGIAVQDVAAANLVINHLASTKAAL